MRQRFIWMALLGIAALTGCMRPAYEPIPEDECDGCPLKSERTAPKISERRETVDFGAPLTLDQTIEIGLRNNLGSRIRKMESMTADKSAFVKRIKAISESETNPEKRKISARSNLSKTWRLLDAALVHVRAKNAETKERFLAERCKQKTAMDISETFRHASAIGNALAMVNSQKEKSSGNGELDNIAEKLRTDYERLKGRLSYLAGLGRQASFKHPPLLPVVSRLPAIDTFDVNSFEEQAMKHRPEIYENDTQILIQKEEARQAIRSITPDIEFFDFASYASGRIVLADAWARTGRGIVSRLVDSDNKGGVSRQHLMIAAGVIAQTHIALSDYAIKKDRFVLLEQACQRTESTGPPLEKMAAKLRLEEGAADWLAAYHRLCGSIGLDHMKCRDAFLH